MYILICLNLILHRPSSKLQLSNLSANILTPSNGAFDTLENKNLFFLYNGLLSNLSLDDSCFGNKIELLFKLLVNVVAIPVNVSILRRNAD